MNLYALDYEEKTMPFSHQSGEYWFHQLAPYLSEKAYKNNPEEHIEGMMPVAFCPATKRQDLTDDSYYGSAYLSWRFMGGEGSYGLNLWLLPDDPIYAPSFPAGNFFKKYSDAQGNMPPGRALPRRKLPCSADSFCGLSLESEADLAPF